jgi:hypothetical protein
MPFQEGFQANLEDVRLPSVQCFDPIGININPDHVVTELRHASGVGRTHVVRANDAHLQCHPEILPQLANRMGRFDNAVNWVTTGFSAPGMPARGLFTSLAEVDGDADCDRSLDPCSYD